MVRETSGLGAKQWRPTIHANSSPGSRGSNRHCEPQLLDRFDFRVSTGKHGERSEKWFDLPKTLFQTGKPALDAINVFHPATYLNHLNADEYAADELSQSALRTMVRCYGQMPIQVSLKKAFFKVLKDT